ncbi:AMP-binding protein [candidate division KSB1 bacterium]|nr:AMP-binding protein [candidate division KSB1 bacterium]NIR72330.1 AMP-binding protein [candidate division KSB1 bacterium]NIS26722.1 AMP-binding protein [candidate division KSB1 bacterium]NIT73468.1 AMP-binding protein [candidate division KSB1 bacterium]NIU27337.1 AMP-binding protein [candidate division KSB1 bacterium]
MSHAFERTVDYLYFLQGTSIVYSGIDTVTADLIESRATIMASVPRFFEKVKATTENNLQEEGFLRKMLFNWAVNVGRKKIESNTIQAQNGFMLNMLTGVADRMVLSKVLRRTGGNLRYFISGGAPLSVEVGRFFYALGLKILEGYGLSETSPVISVNPPQRPKLGTVGNSLPGVHVQIAEDGEVLTRGPNVMVGYYKMSKETEEAIVDGWFHTGDIGNVDEEGYLSIKDRKKQLIVTSVGKKVAPQVIEKQVEGSKYIEQVVLIGEKRNFISAVIVPNFEALKSYLGHI